MKAILIAAAVLMLSACQVNVVRIDAGPINYTDNGISSTTSPSKVGAE